MADEESVKVRWLLDESDYVSGLKNVDKQSDTTNKNIQADNTKTSKSWKDMGLQAKIGIGLAITALTGVISKLKDAADASAEYTRSMRGLNEVAKAFGQDGGTAQKFAKEIESMTGGMVSAQEAAQGLKFLISSGYSLDKASEMSKAMLNIGAFNNVVGDLGQAFVDASKGIKTGSIELIENIGLTERMSSIMKKAGVSTKDGIDITNNAEQAQAFYNSVLEQGAIFAGNLDEAVQGYDASMADASLTMDKFIRKIGDKLKPVISGIATAFSSVLKPFVEDTPTASEKLASLITEVETLQSKTELTAEEQERLYAAMNEIAKIAPSVVIGYDNQSNAIVNLHNATKELIAMKKLELENEKARLELEAIESEEALKKSNEKKIRLETKHNNLMTKLRNIWERDLEKVETLKQNRASEARIKEAEEEARLDRERMLEVEEQYNAENRTFLARHNQLETENKLLDARIEKLDTTIEKLKEAKSASEVTTIVKPDKEEPTSKVKKDVDSGVSIIPLSKLNEVSNKDLVTFYENKAEIVKQGNLSLSELNKVSNEDLVKAYETNAKAREEQLAEEEKARQQAIKDEENFLEQKKSIAEKLAAVDREENDKELEASAEYMKEKIKQDAKEEAAIGARMALKKAESQLVQDLVDGQKLSLNDYANIIATEVEITLTGIAVESGIQSLYNLAKGFAFTAMGKADSAANAFTASATFATTAAAAGLGATAANAIGSATASAEETEVPTDTETDTIIETQTEAITEDTTIYISQSDWKKMAFQNVDAINEALKDGKKLALKG